MDTSKNFPIGHFGTQKRFAEGLRVQKAVYKREKFLHTYSVVAGYGVIGVWRGARGNVDASQFSKAERLSLTVQSSMSSPSKVR